MELTKDKVKEKAMAAEKLAFNTPAVEAIKFITSTLSIKETMLAALLRVTERTLANWKEKTLDELDNSRGKRLGNLYFAIIQATGANIPSNQIMSLLDLPFDPSSDESGTILGFIVEEVEFKALNPLIKKQIQDFLKK